MCNESKHGKNAIFIEERKKLVLNKTQRKVEEAITTLIRFRCEVLIARHFLEGATVSK